MTAKAIPTTYNGINFRSRVEARWAAFMDELGWTYEYEPQDFDGYIPDFFVNGQFWLEVKAGLTLDDLQIEVPKVRRALKGDGHRAIIVGNVIDSLSDDHAFGIVAIGENDLIAFRDEGDFWVSTTGGNAVWGECPLCGGLIWFEDRDDYFFACKACPDAGNKRSFATTEWELAKIRESWLVAGNRVQWQGRRSDMNDYVRDILQKRTTYEEVEALLIQQVRDELTELFSRGIPTGR